MQLALCSNAQCALVRRYAVGIQCAIDTDQGAADMIQTRSQQIEVTVTRIDRALEFVGGCKRNVQIGGGYIPFSVFFRDDEPVKIDGAGRLHPKLVLAAASAAWRNV